MSMTVKKIRGRWQPVTHTGEILWDVTHNVDLTGYTTKAGAMEALCEIGEAITWFCVCSWIGQDPDERRGKPPSCPACWKIDRRRVDVQVAPPCRLAMGCLCCYHARGGDHRFRCNADESVWPCRFCSRFPGWEFEGREHGKCAACHGTGIHPTPDGNPADEDADDGVTVCCSKCGGANVQHAAWIRSNTEEVVEDFGTWNAGDNTFCEDCGENTDLVCKGVHFERFAALRAANRAKAQE